MATEVIVRWWSVLLAAGGLAASVSSGGSAAPAPIDEEVVMILSGRETSSPGYGSVEFVIAGKAIKGMYPGLVKGMKIALINPYPFDLVVRRIESRVVSSSRRACRPGPATLTTRSYQGTLPLRLPARSTTKAGSIPVYMPPDASPACQNTRFTIRMTGSGTRQGR
jgi:hypothetical protein